MGWLRQQASDEIHQARVICEYDNSQGSPHPESLLKHSSFRVTSVTRFDVRIQVFEVDGGDLLAPSCAGGRSTDLPATSFAVWLATSFAPASVLISL